MSIRNKIALAALISCLCAPAYGDGVGGGIGGADGVGSGLSDPGGIGATKINLAPLPPCGSGVIDLSTGCTLGVIP
jgi:hypothetical protein